MAFGGLLEGFLAEKSYDEPRRGRHVRMEMNQRRSLTGPESDKLTLKKLSTVSSPYPKYSWPMMVSREGAQARYDRPIYIRLFESSQNIGEVSNFAFMTAARMTSYER
ncbi:hypothetical protein RB195_017143 [Necator americanus]|uniref:Uncharacterized protein n=1 Tax=Necator americanus TaxID=51031 RepID=A0ABR1C610_NECAM